jgi:hypothetical protein
MLNAARSIALLGEVEFLLKHLGLNDVDSLHEDVRSAHLKTWELETIRTIAVPYVP